MVSHYIIIDISKLHNRRRESQHLNQTMKTLQRFTLLVVICLTAVVSANSNHVRSAATTSTPASSHNQRRELGVSDWWYTLLNLLHAPCPSDHDHTLQPHGHCAHHSHHKPSSHHSSGGSSHSSSSGGSSGGSSVWNNDGHHDDDKWGDDGHAEWNNDGHDDDKWGDDGHDDAEWNNDGHDDDDKWDVSSEHFFDIYLCHTYKQNLLTLIVSPFLHRMMGTITTTSIPTGQETHMTTMEAAVVIGGVRRLMPPVDIIMPMTTEAVVV